MKYHIRMTADALVETSVEVEAISLDDASAQAIQMAKSGDIVWTYAGADDSTVEIERVEEQAA